MNDIKCNDKVAWDMIIERDKRIAELEAELEAVKKIIRDKYKNANEVLGLDLGKEVETMNINYELMFDEDREYFSKQISGLSDIIKNLASSIHYPQCWDTACYPTLEHALHEIGCSECKS